MRSAGLKEEELEETDLDQLDEVLSADAKASDWIHDFVHSTNPKFEGKTKAERIKMALGAYYNTKNKQDGAGVNENTSVDEGVLGAVSGAIAGGLAGGPIGALAGAYLGHKVQQGANNSKKLVKATSSRRLRKEQAPVAPVPDKKYIKGTPENKAYKATKKPINGMPTNLRKEGLEEAVRTTHEDPLVTVHDKHGLHTHANLSTANAIFGTSVGHKDVHAGPVKTKVGHPDDDGHHGELTFAISKHHESSMKESKDYEYADGDMSITQLKQIKAHSEWILEMLEPGTDMPEWVQSKITLAADYLSTACDYLHVELNEATTKKVIGQPVDADKVHAAGQEPHEEKWVDAKKKPVKEQYDEDGNIIYQKKSFQQFVEGMTATQVRPGVTRYTGGSYGSSKGSKYGNTDYDSEDIDKKDDESQEQQKRGRGRPAGSKSGARGPRIK
jgi:uncharacterized protein YcfJ